MITWLTQKTENVEVKGGDGVILRATAGTGLARGASRIKLYAETAGAVVLVWKGGSMLLTAPEHEIVVISGERFRLVLEAEQPATRVGVQTEVMIDA